MSNEQLPTDLLEPSREALLKIEGLQKFVDDMHDLETMPSNFPAIAKELLLHQRIEVNLQRYEVLDVLPDGSLKAEIVEQGTKTGQVFILPWDSFKGFTLVRE